MKILNFSIYLIILIYLSSCSHKKPSSEQLSRGKEIYNSCQLCHSKKELQRGPIIDGLPAFYSYSQLERFKNGIRGQNPKNASEHLMGAALANLNKEDLLAVSAYISTLELKPYKASIRGDETKGKALYEKNCKSCHGASAQGSRFLKTAPLAMMEDWYLLQQLNNFKK